MALVPTQSGEPCVGGPAAALSAGSVPDMVAAERGADTETRPGGHRGRTTVTPVDRRALGARRAPDRAAQVGQLRRLWRHRRRARSRRRPLGKRRPPTPRPRPSCAASAFQMLSGRPTRSLSTSRRTTRSTSTSGTRRASRWGTSASSSRKGCGRGSRRWARRPARRRPEGLGRRLPARGGASPGWRCCRARSGTTAGRCGRRRISTSTSRRSTTGSRRPTSARTTSARCCWGSCCSSPCCSSSSRRPRW